MYIWKIAPFVRLLLPFLLGIVFSVYFPFSIQYPSVFVAIFFFIISVIALTPKLYIPYRRSWIYGILVFFALFLLGFQLTIIKTELYANNHFSVAFNKDDVVYYKIVEPIIEKEKSIKAVVEVKGLFRNKNYIATEGRAVAYFEKTAKSFNLKYGDEFISKTVFKNIPTPQNPNEFNYKRYLSFQNINYQNYFNDKSWVHTTRNSGNLIFKNAQILRDYLLTIFTKHEIKDDEFAVGSALLLGYEDKLDSEIISAYSSTGALHVLSVSGLHVGIVFIVFNWLLFFFDKIKYGNIFKAIILLFLLWFYATLTGLSPSVLRSATMFSFIIVAKSLNRKSNIYNTLALSAFFLLLINPYLIMDVGFQLSYLAVIGIVYIQPKINNWISFDNRVMNSIWAISSVSIAAQIATFPLGLHYFHQFPNYFLFSNLIVIPLSTIVIYLGLSMFVFAKVSIVVGYLALAFNSVVWLLNSSVKWMEQLPFALIEKISISVFETWLIYIAIVTFLLYLSKRKFMYLIISLVMTMCILCYQVVQQHSEFKQRQLIVYNISKTSAIDFVNGKQNVLYTDSLFATNESRLMFHVKHNWWDLGLLASKIVVTDYENSFVKIKNDFIQFGRKRIKIINKKNEVDDENKNAITLDYIILSGNPKISIENIVEKFKPTNIIFDSSNSQKQIEKWTIACKRLNVGYYSVEKSGAFILNF